MEQKDLSFFDLNEMYDSPKIKPIRESLEKPIFINGHLILEGTLFEVITKD